MYCVVLRGNDILFGYKISDVLSLITSLSITGYYKSSLQSPIATLPNYLSHSII